jgi:FK506-binding protein 4/5
MWLPAPGVIVGWSEGVATMKKGERAMFEIVSDKAYGARGSPPKIPGGATLKFDIGLISFTPPPPTDVTASKDGGVLMKKVTSGVGWQKPEFCAKVTCDFKLMLDDGSVCKEKATVEFVVDDGEVMAGLETAVQAMTKGEIALFTIAPKYGFGADGDDALKVPAFATLLAEVTLTDFTNEEKVRTAAGVLAKKEQGTVLFKKGDWFRAVRRYEAALELITDAAADSDETGESKKALLPCHLNAAACWLKLNKLDACIEKCTVRVFRQKVTLDYAVGSHACSRQGSIEASRRVSNGISRRCPLFLPVHVVNSVQPLKATRHWPSMLTA